LIGICFFDAPRFITSLTRGDRRLEWLSVPERSYQVYATTNVAQSFQPLSGIIVAGTGLN